MSDGHRLVSVKVKQSMLEIHAVQALYWHRVLARLTTSLRVGTPVKQITLFTDVHEEVRASRRLQSDSTSCFGVENNSRISPCFFLPLFFTLENILYTIPSRFIRSSSFFENKLLSSRKEARQELRINFHENFCQGRANTWTTNIRIREHRRTETRPRSDNENPSDPVIIWHCTLAELTALTIVLDVVNFRSWLLATWLNEKRISRILCRLQEFYKYEEGINIQKCQRSWKKNLRKPRLI